MSLRVEGVSKIYPDGTKALNQINFTIKPGEAVVLLGHNGSGKSTLFRCMTCFEKPSEGSVFLDDINITNMSQRQLRPIRNKMGMVFQHFHLINNLTVFQNVLFGALGSVRFSFQTFSPLASNELREKAMEYLHRVGLSHLAKRRTDQLSGGQQQRVAIARMLMQEPEVVLADEPIASLDPKAGREVMDLLWDVVEERGLSVISILHQMDIAKEYGNRIIALKKGNVVLDENISNISDEFLQDLYKLDVEDSKGNQNQVTEKGA